MLIIKAFRLIKIKFLAIKYKKRFTCGKNILFRRDFSIRIAENGYVKIGNGCFFNNSFHLTSLCGVEIGSNCIFGENVKIYDHNHNYCNVDQLIKSQGFTYSKVKIGDNCWIGSNVVVLKGVKIGSNCVIGANTLVYKDIPDNSLVIHSEKMIIKER